MQNKTPVSTTWAILHQMCPRCRSARIFPSSIFTGFPRMRERCPVCSLKFEREEGYFLGAMYISYSLALLTVVVLSGVLWGVDPMVAAEGGVVGAFVLLAHGAIP